LIDGGDGEERKQRPRSMWITHPFLKKFLRNGQTADKTQIKELTLFLDKYQGAGQTAHKGKKRAPSFPGILPGIRT